MRFSAKPAKLDAEKTTCIMLSALICLLCVGLSSVGLYEKLYAWFNYPALSDGAITYLDMLEGRYKPELLTVLLAGVKPLMYLSCAVAYILGIKGERKEIAKVVGLSSVLFGAMHTVGAASALAAYMQSPALLTLLLRSVLPLLTGGCALLAAGVLLRRGRCTAVFALAAVSAVMLRLLAGQEVLGGITDYGVAGLYLGLAAVHVTENKAQDGKSAKKTLYVSDLDGTLLRSDETVSGLTCDAINELVEGGMLFSYATARSYRTASKVTRGLSAEIPLIVYNGAMIVDNTDGSHISVCSFGGEAHDILTELLAHEVYPIVYSIIDGEEKFSYIPEKCTPGMARFTESRRGDVRENIVSSADELYRGDIFYFTCIGEPERLEGFYDLFRKKYHCVFQVDMYTNAQWLEIMPREATKANAARRLARQLGCDRLVAFGDGVNDIELFRAADDAYAVENAADELKEAATGIIGSNDSDGVARWLLKNADTQYAE